MKHLPFFKWILVHQERTILWFFLKHWHGCQHSCPYLKRSLIPSKIKALFSVWSHWPENSASSRNCDFSSTSWRFFFFKCLLFLHLSQWWVLHCIHLAAHQSAFFALQVFDGIKAACLKSFVAGWGTRCFSQIELISSTCHAFVWKWAVRLLQLSQPAWEG